MGMYNMMMGVDPVAYTLLKELGFTSTDQIPRFRDCYFNEDCSEVVILTRTGGGNREGYEEQNNELANHPMYIRDEDAEGDETYAYFYFKLPEVITEEDRMLVIDNGHAKKPAIDRLFDAINSMGN